MNCNPEQQMSPYKHVIFGLALLSAVPGCPTPEDEDQFLVLHAADEAEANSELGILLLVHAGGGGAVTVEASGGVLLDPGSDEPTLRLCLRPGTGAHPIAFVLDPELAVGRVTARLWDEELAGLGSTLDCDDVTTLLATASLLISADGSPAQTDTSIDETETGP
jgi:hypothetical protein